MTIYTTPESLGIIPEKSRASQLSEALGGGLTQGIQSGLELLAQDKIEKMKQMGQQQKFAQLQSILGGSDVPGEDIEVDFLDSARPPSSFKSADLTDAQILAVSQLDPTMGKLLQAQKSMSGKEVASRFKETKDIRKEILNQSKAARENDTRLERMKQLNASGKLIDPLYNATLEKLGLDIPALKNPDSQEFEKLTNDMFRNIREIFGNRINVIEIITFLKTIPTLSQSQEGRNRVIRNLKLLNRGAQARVKAMKEIIKENGGTPPYDLGEQVEERISPELDNMSAQFIAGPSPSFDTLPAPSGIKKTEISMIDPQGRRRAVEKKDVKAAKAAGYKLQ